MVQAGSQEQKRGFLLMHPRWNRMMASCYWTRSFSLSRPPFPLGANGRRRRHHGKREANEARERASERAIEGTRDRVRDRPTDRPTDSSERRSVRFSAPKEERGRADSQDDRGRERSLTRAVYLIRTQSSRCHDAIFFLKFLRVQCSWKMGMTGRTRPHSRKWLHSTQKFVGNER